MSKQFFFIYSIINMMHKPFYASGFLYHLDSQQILLQQDTTSKDILSQWYLFEGQYTEKNTPEIVFKKILHDLLDLKIDTVHSIYSYENEKANQYVVYAEIDELRDFEPKNGIIFNWFSFKNIYKLQVAKQTKHDIVVGQRVIEASGRKSRGEHTFQ
jgi:hypothetical protein